MKLRTVILPLIGINLVAFFLQQLIPGFTDLFLLVGKDVFSRPWILLTSMFLHGGFEHLFFNMYGLFLFGPLLEHRIGPKKFLFVYIGSGLIAALFSSFFYARALGASGAIMGMLGALIILMPNLKLLFFFLIPMPLWFAGIIWAAMDFFGIFVSNGIANIAHLVGMGSGLSYGVFLKSKKKSFDKRFANKTHMDSDDIKDYFRSGRI